MVKVDGYAFNARASGEGIPVLFLHGAFIHSFLNPLADKLAATKKFRTVTYARRGFDGKQSGPIDINGQAADAVAVLTQSGISKAHIVGHSFGGNVALQLAKRSPEVVASVILLEPPLFSHVPSGQEMRNGMELLSQVFGGGKREEALTAAITGLCGPEFKTLLQPGMFEQALTDLDTFFKIESPSLMKWDKEFGPDAAKAITQPVLFVSGDKSPLGFREVGPVLKTWMSQTETLDIAGATHLFPMTHADQTSEAIASFCERAAFGD